MVVGHRRRARRRHSMMGGRPSLAVSSFASSATIRVISLTTVLSSFDRAGWGGIAVAELRAHRSGGQGRDGADVGKVLGVEGW